MLFVYPWLGGITFINKKVEPSIYDPILFVWAWPPNDIKIMAK